MSETLNSQPAPAPGITPVTPHAREIFLRTLDAQVKRGLEKYGTTLHTHNGRDAGQDATEELVDALHYVTQARLELYDARALLGTIRDEVDAAVASPETSVARFLALHRLLHGQVSNTASVRAAALLKWKDTAIRKRV